MAKHSNARHAAHSANRGYASQTNREPAPQDNRGYAPQNDVGYVSQENDRYVPQDNAGYAPQGNAYNGGYAPQGNRGYAPQGSAYHNNIANSGTSMYVSDYSRTNYSKKGGRRRKGHAGLIAFVIILILIVAAAGVVGFNGYKLYQSAQHVRAQASEAMDDIKTIKADLVSGKAEDAQRVAQHLSNTAASMKKETDGTLWQIGEKIPVYGEDIATVRTLSGVLEDVSVNALEPLCNQMSGISLKSLINDEGDINVDQITSLITEMSTVAPVLQRSVDAFNSCPEPHLDQVKSVIGKASTELEEANDLFSFASQFAPLIADVLGANGTRYYFVAAQNNVEVRSTGGFYGSAGMVTVDNGHISIGEFGTLHYSIYDEAYTSNDIASTQEAIGIIEWPSGNLYNLGGNPDVPHVAQMFASACDAAGTPINGFVLVDPIFVQYMVALTGGFTASDGTWVDGSNLATVLMHDTYWDYYNDNDSQDAFFASVANDAAKHVFSSLGNLDMKEFANTMLDAAKKRHFSLWFADADAQAAAVSLGMAGTISTDPTQAVTGVYFDNNSWSKLEWYLRASTEVTSETKNADGSTSYGVTLKLTNDIPDSELNAGYQYVTGGNGAGNKIMYQAGDMLETVYLLAPAGGGITDVWTDGDVYDSDQGYLYGEEIVRRKIHLLPGDTVTFTYTVTTSPQAKGALEFDMTPLAQDVR